MPRRKTDADNPPRFLSILAAAAGPLVAHRFLLRLSLVLMVGVVLMTREPDEVREGLNTIIESAPVQLVARALFNVSGITFGALPTAPRRAPQAVSTPMVRDGAGGSSTATPSSTPGPLSQTAPQDPGVKTLVPAGRVEHQRPQVLGGRGDGQIRGSRGRPNASSNRISVGDPRDSLLWSLEKDGETVRAIVQERGSAGVDLLMFRNGRLWRSERWADRESATNAAQARRTNFEKQGWTPRLERDR